MHEFRKFIQAELDSRGWVPGKLASVAGMHRQTISKIVKDKRDHLGQMPEESTLQGIARGFEIDIELVRKAAARSLAGYEDDGGALSTNLRIVHIDALLGELRRRAVSHSPETSTGYAVLDELAEGGGIHHGDDSQEQGA